MINKYMHKYPLKKRHNIEILQRLLDRKDSNTQRIDELIKEIGVEGVEMAQRAGYVAPIDWNKIDINPSELQKDGSR